MKKIKILTIILLIVLVTMVAFFGVYTQVQNRMEDNVKEYTYAMDLTGARQVRLIVDTTTNEVIKDKDGNEVESATDEEIEENGYVKEEVAVNSEEILNSDNYKTTKKIIEKRLGKLNVKNYLIRLDEETGDIIIELPENDDTDTIISNISSIGKFEIADADTEEVLLNNSDIKTVQTLYNTTTTGTSVYLQLEFNKDGTKKLEDISNTYVKVDDAETSTNEESGEETVEETTEETEETTSEEESSATSTEKKITMKIDDEQIMSTNFEEPVKNGIIQLSVGSASTDIDTVNEYIESAQSIATLLNEGQIPIKYTIDENKYVESDLKIEDFKNAGIVLLAVIAIALIVLIIKYRAKGVLAAISYIGLASVLLLIVRYTNIIISIESISAIIFTLILNYVFTFKLLADIKENKELKKTTRIALGDNFVNIIGLCILTVAFSFVSWMPISNFGLVMFWGLVIMAIYNILITNNLLKINEEK